MKIAGHPISEVAPGIREITIFVEDAHADDDDPETGDRSLRGIHIDALMDGDHVCKNVAFSSRHELAETLYPILKEMGIR